MKINPVLEISENKQQFLNPCYKIANIVFPFVSRYTGAVSAQSIDSVLLFYSESSAGSRRDMCCDIYDRI